MTPNEPVMRTVRAHAWSLALLCLALGCGDAPDSSTRTILRDAGTEAESALDASHAADESHADVVDPYTRPPETLDAWKLFADAPKQVPGPRTVPYDVIAPLFSDYAQKRRFMYVPEGATIHYDDAQRWKFPEGSVLIKTFAYPIDARDPTQGVRLLETRLLVFTKSGVVPHTYVWNQEQTVATRDPVGGSVSVRWVDASGTTRTNRYGIPNQNECYECHGEDHLDTLGGRTRQLDRDFDYGEGPVNQIDHWFAQGLLDQAPKPFAERVRLVNPDDPSQPVHERARAYLDANCAACHASEGAGSTSAMYVSYPDTAPDKAPVTWGVCKQPDSAGGATCGRQLDIVPGQPDQSIYLCRVESDDPKVQMPPLGRHLVHKEGAALLRAWILGLPGSCD